MTSESARATNRAILCEVKTPREAFAQDLLLQACVEINKRSAAARRVAEYAQAIRGRLDRLSRGFDLLMRRDAWMYADAWYKENARKRRRAKISARFRELRAELHLERLRHQRAHTMMRDWQAIAEAHQRLGDSARLRARLSKKYRISDEG